MPSAPYLFCRLLTKGQRRVSAREYRAQSLDRLAKIGELKPLRKAAAQRFLSAPYSPDFNPIENAFAKLKALMGAKVEGTIPALWPPSIIELFTPAECTHYFKAAGYKPDLL